MLCILALNRAMMMKYGGRATNTTLEQYFEYTFEGRYQNTHLRVCDVKDETEI